MIIINIAEWILNALMLALTVGLWVAVVFGALLVISTTNRMIRELR